MLEFTLYIAAVCLLLLVNGVGIVLTALQLPGNWLMVAATAVFAWWQWGPPEDRVIGWYALAAILGLALLGELLEFLAGALGAKTGGASKRGAMISIVTAILGAILGSFLIPIPIIGTLIGAAAGAGVGSFLGDKWAGREWGRALRGASGAAIGRLTGAAMKIIVAVVLWVTVLIAIVF